ncbi:MAG TPA: flagellar hook protein FlgE [Planctomycetota bacterium]|nr:flagellar hook protein FlgE [Planctomycetota bacterium]
MSLSQSLYSAISGLINHQTKMDVIGNNLSNINTVGYKRGVMQFADVFSRTLRGGSAPGGNVGGTNPLQIGLGMQISSVSQDFGQGAMESTGRPSDLAIEGDGFFKLVNAGETRYSRDGAFTLGQSGEILNSFGFRLQGWMADATGAIDTGGPTTDLLIPLGELRIARATTESVFAGNLNASGATAVANTAVADNNNVQRSGELFLSDGVTPVGAGTQLQDVYSGGVALFPGLAANTTLTIAATKGNRSISTDITVSPTTTLTTLMASIRNALGIQTGDTAAGVSLVAGSGGGGVIRVVGNLGEFNEITGLSLTPAGGSTLNIFSQSAAANGESAVTTLGVYDSLGDVHMVTMTMTLISQNNTGSTWRWYADCADDSTPALGVGTGTVVFDSNGQFVSESNNLISIDLTNQGVATPLAIDPDFSIMTQFASADGSSVEARSQNGSPMGSLTAYSISDSGIISGLFSNGLRQDLGQVNVTRFANNNGLLRDAQNLFTAGANSGLAQDGVAYTAARGSILSGALETSNVDVAKEFTDMILTQRGFQANARTISTSDEMLVELMNITR